MTFSIVVGLSLCVWLTSHLDALVPLNERGQESRVVQEIFAHSHGHSTASKSLKRYIAISETYLSGFRFAALTRWQNQQR
jgi:hypothetical protein